MTDDGNIVRGKFSYTERQRRIEIRERRVPCEIHERWLQFPKDAKDLKPTDLFTVYVMTQSDEGISRRLCELILCTRDIRAVLDAIDR